MYSYRELSRVVARKRPAMLLKLAELVGIESPTEDRAAVNESVALVEQWVQAIGGRGKRSQQSAAGDHLTGYFGPAQAKVKPVMLLGHLDTVWPLGTLSKMPFRVRAGRAWGPGVLDMKAGVVMALTALEILGDQLTRPVILLLNSDEETGSEHSRALTESLARKCSAVFVLEPAQGLAGAYKTARKGVAGYRVQVRGVAAHSGVDFAHGHSAVLELGRQIERASGFTNLERGITVNAGVIGGGTRSNVVPAEAWAEFDVRIARAVDGPKIDRRFRSLRPWIASASSKSQVDSIVRPWNEREERSNFFDGQQLSPQAWVFNCRKRQPVEAPMGILPPPWEYQRSMEWARLARSTCRP